MFIKPFKKAGIVALHNIDASGFTVYIVIATKTLSQNTFKPKTIMVPTHICMKATFEIGEHLLRVSVN